MRVSGVASPNNNKVSAEGGGVAPSNITHCIITNSYTAYIHYTIQLCSRTHTQNN